MFKRNMPRVPIYERAECRGEDCPQYNGQDCDSRLELLQATGKSGGIDLSPRVKDCSFALYGQVCMGEEEQLVVAKFSESPNGEGNPMEAIALTGLTENRRIVLNTPAEDAVFPEAS